MSLLSLSLSIALTHDDELQDKSEWQTPPTDSNGFSHEVPCTLLTSQSVSPQGSWNQFVARNLVSLILLLDFQIYCDNFFRWDGMTITASDSGIWSSTNRWCLEEQNASTHLISEFLCAESIDTEQLSEDPHTKAEGWNLTRFAWNICRNPDSMVYYARKQRVPCATENHVALWCLWDQFFKNIQDCNRSCSPWEIKCAISPRENLETIFQAEIFFMGLAT